MIHVNFVIPCDTAFFAADSKLNIIGIFNKAAASETPVNLQPFSLAIQMIEDGIEKDTPHKLKIFFQKDGVNKTPQAPEVDFQNSPNAITAIVNKVTGLSFDEFGTYKIILFIDGKEINTSTEIEVIKQ